MPPPRCAPPLPGTLLAAACAVGAAACVPSSTGLLVQVDSDVAPTALRELSLSARLEGDLDGATERSWLRTSTEAGAFSLPFSFGVLAAPGGQRRRVEVRISVQSDDGQGDLAGYERRVRTSFVEGRVQRVSVFLAARCLARVEGCLDPTRACTLGRYCSELGLTCGDQGRCIDALPPSDADGGAAPDAAQDATVDSGASCPAGQTLCAGRCVDLRTDEGNCGQCGRSCGAPARGTPVCAAGSCVLACDYHYADCDRSYGNGCEVHLIDDERNCSTCGHACASGEQCLFVSGSTARCCLGGCSSGCSSPFRSVTTNSGACHCCR